MRKNNIQKNWDAAKEACHEALDLTEQYYGKKHIKYARVLSFYAETLAFSNIFDEAIKYGLESLTIIDSIDGSYGNEYAYGLSRMAHIYANAKDYEKAFFFEKKYIEKMELLYGKNSYLFLNGLKQLAIYAYICNKKEESLNAFSSFINNTQKYILQSQKGISNKEFSSLLGIHRDAFERSCPALAFETNNDSIILLAYNSLLFSKELANKREQIVINYFSDNHDEDLESIYESLIY